MAFSLVAGILGRGLVALSSTQGESCVRLFGFGSQSRANGCVSGCRLLKIVGREVDCLVWVLG